MLSKPVTDKLYNPDNKIFIEDISISIIPLWNCFIFNAFSWNAMDFKVTLQAFLNPRLPKVFSVTHLPRDGYHPLWTWNWHAQSMIVWYHSIGEGPPFPLIPKFWKSANVWRHNDVFKYGRPQNADFQGNIGQNWIFAKRAPNIGIFTRFFFIIKEGNGVSKMFCKFQHHTMNIFFKMAT